MTHFSALETERIRAALQKLAESSIFAQAGRMVRFLTYAVDEVLADRGHRINQYSLGIDVFDRDNSFDPAVDSIVRVEASRLRSKLREYYDTVGKSEAVHFELPKGSYELKIHLTPQPAAPAAQQGFARAVTAPPRGFSIAICPFEPISDNEQDEPLGDAIAAQIIDALSGTTGFEVISRKTSFAFKGQDLDVRELGKALGVDYLIDGNVQRVGNHLRIGVGLVDARSGVQVWRAAYTRDAGQLFVLADDLSASITASLNLVLWRVAVERAQRGLSENPEPAEIVQWVASWIYFRYSRETVEEGERRALSALERFPDLGHLHALHAMSLAQQVFHCWAEEPARMRPRALAAANRAVDLDPYDCWVLTWAGNVLSWLGEQQASMTLAERALAREPHNPVHRGRLGEALIHVNQVAEGLEAIEDAIAVSGPELTPAIWEINRGLGYSHLGRYEEAAGATRRAVQLVPGASNIWVMLANALGEIGESDNARHAIAEGCKSSPNLTAAHYEWLFRYIFDSDEHVDRHVGGLQKIGFK